MTRLVSTEYKPETISPPGWTLAEMLEERDLKQRELAVRIGVSPKHISNVVTGDADISPELALALEKALGAPARFWLARDARYQEYRARAKQEEELAQHVEWARKFPLRQMVNYGFITKPTNALQAVQKLLRFFGVASPEDYQNWWTQLQPSFRRCTLREPDQHALAAWLRRGELIAQRTQTRPYNAEKLASCLPEFRALTLEDPNVFQSRIREKCAECGVVVAFVPELPKSYVSGATRWLAPDKALVQLSLYYKRDDMLWFAFFHELCHVLKHPKRLTYMRDLSHQDDEHEVEANRFAADKLIPKEKYSRFARKYLLAGEVVDFAKSIGIAPGIVVGRLQFDGYLPKSHLNKLKKLFDWAARN